MNETWTKSEGLCVVHGATCLKRDLKVTIEASIHFYREAFCG